MAVLPLRHFSTVEFRCKCGCGVGMEKMDADLLQMLDEARELAGRCVDSHSRFAMLQALLEAGFRRIELAPTWIHVDNDPDKPHDAAFYQHGGKY